MKNAAPSAPKEKPYAGPTCLLAIMLSAILLAALCGPAQAASGDYGYLQGQIVTWNHGTSHPVPGATVRAYSKCSTSKAITDRNGFFSMLGVAVGNYAVDIEAPDFYPGYTRDVTVFANQTTPFDYSLLPAGRYDIRYAERSHVEWFQPSVTSDLYVVSSPEPNC